MALPGFASREDFAPSLVGAVGAFSFPASGFCPNRFRRFQLKRSIVQQASEMPAKSMIELSD